MEFLEENNKVKEEALKFMIKFQDMIEGLQKSDVESTRRKISEAPDLKTKSQLMRNFLETNVPASAVLLDMLLETDKKNSLLYLEWMSHRQSVAMSFESFSKAQTIAEKAYAIAKDLYLGNERSCVEAGVAKKSVFEAYLKSCIDLLLVFRFQGKITDAEAVLAEATKVASLEGDVDGHHRLRVLHGDLLLARGQLNNAIENVFNPLLDTKDLSECNRGLLLQKLGNACRSAARWGLAKDYLRDSIRIARNLGDLIAEYDRVADLGNVYRSEGRIANALKEQSCHMGYAFGRGDLWGLTVACFNMGFSYYSVTPQPDLRRALILLSLKYDLALRTENEPLRGMALNNLGKVFCALGQHDTALKVMTQSVEVARKTLNIAGEGMAYGNIGTSYRYLGKYEEAILNHTKYLENAAARGDDGGVAIMQRELATDYVCKGDIERAEQQIRNAISTLESIRNKLGSEDSSKIANFDKNQAETYSLLQVILVRQRKFSEALALSELARSRALTDLIRDSVIKKSGTQSSWIYCADPVSRGTSLVEEILSDYIATSDALKTNFVVYSVLKDYDSNAVAHQWLYIWVLLTEEAAKGGERIHFKRMVLGETIQGQLIDSGFFTSLTRSFRSESSKEKVLGVNTTTTGDVKEAEEESSTGRMPEGIEVEELLTLLEALSLSKLPDKECDVSSRQNKEGLRNVGVTRDSPTSEDEENEAVENRGERYMIRVMELGSWNKEGLKQLRRLYDVCVSVIDEYLPENSEENVPKLTIIPHASLFSVPFCCLQDGKGKYLVERFVISYSSSLRALCLLNHRLKYLRDQQGQRKLKLLAIGYPATSVPDTKEIPFSAEEAKNVQGVFGTEQCQLALRTAATKKLLLSELKNVDILHVASHACPENEEVRLRRLRSSLRGIFKFLAGDDEFLGDYSMRGCLLFASSGEECDGAVEAGEIAAVNCNCQLVTLSCCETGLGKLTGDGVVGLYRAFFAAGAASVLVTLWKIEDCVTPPFMEHFYTEFKVTGNVSHSLRWAMLHCIEEKRLPSQWAAFSFYGAEPSIAVT